MRMLFTTAILVFTVSTLSAAGQAGPDGERLYQQYCARCHDADMPTVFMQGTIQDLSAERVYEALVYFFMQRNAATLTKAQKRAVAEHVAGSAPGSLVPAIDQVPRAAYCEAGTGTAGDPLSGATWNGWSPGLDNTRFQTAAAAGLTKEQVSDMELRWAFGLPGSSTVSMQATVAGGRLFFGTSVDLVFALDADTGCVHWVHETDYGVRAALVVGPGETGRFNVYVGDTGANVYALDFATGDSYSDPVAPESDAIMALAMDTGCVWWVTQTTPGDAWTGACLAADEADRAGCPDSNGPDHDYRSAVVRVASSNGEPVLLAGQKSGVMCQMDPATGEVQWETRIADGGVLGGIEWGFATDGEVVYASISDALRFRSRSNRHRSRRRLDRDVALKILPEGVRWTTHRRLNATSES